MGRCSGAPSCQYYFLFDSHDVKFYNPNGYTALNMCRLYSAMFCLAQKSRLIFLSPLFFYNICKQSWIWNKISKYVMIVRFFVSTHLRWPTTTILKAYSKISCVSVGHILNNCQLFLNKLRNRSEIDHCPELWYLCGVHCGVHCVTSRKLNALIPTMNSATPPTTGTTTTQLRKRAGNWAPGPRYTTLHCPTLYPYPLP